MKQVAISLFLVLICCEFSNAKSYGKGNSLFHYKLDTISDLLGM